MTASPPASPSGPADIGAPPPALAHVIERFDHVAFAAADARTALPLMSLLGAGYLTGGHHPTGGFRWLHFVAPGGLKLEIVAPFDPTDRDHFLVRFLDRGGRSQPLGGVHHLTFKVHDLDVAVSEATARGYDVVGLTPPDSGWREAFLHPRSTDGVLIQLAQWDGVTTETADRAEMAPSTRLDAVLADPTS